MRRRKRSVTVKMSDNLFELLEAYRIKHNISRAEAVRRAVKHLLGIQDNSEGS